MYTLRHLSTKFVESINYNYFSINLKKLERMREIDIRTRLRRNILQDLKDEQNVIIIDELGICQGESRIDIAVVNGELEGFEIKSENDNLNRLPIQVELYNKVFDKISLVTVESHLKKAKKIIPEWWGIILAEQNNDSIKLKKIKLPKKNTNTSPYHIAQLLWKDEVISIILELCPSAKLSNKNRRELWDTLVKITSKDELCKLVRNTMKYSSFRINWRSDSLLKLNDD